MRLAVVILNYKTRDLLRQCLQSVFASARLTADRLTVTVMVVDSASQDGSAEMVAAEFPLVQNIVSPHNIGYTGGNNLALHLLGFAVAPPPEVQGLFVPRADGATPDFVLLLNADTEIVGDALWQMVQALIHQPMAGACGAHLRYGDGAFQHGAFRFPTLFQLALDFFPLTGLPGVQRIYNSRFNGRYPQQLWQSHEPFLVDFVLGAALMVRGAALEQVGGLDSDYFMYCEEMDWCLRLCDAGWRVLAAPTARVIHHEGQSSRQVRWTAYERLWRSRFRFYAKHERFYPPGYLHLVRQLVRVGLWLRTYQAEQRFARGKSSGSEVAAELEAYTRIARF
jgi:hypothetical protein